MLLSRMPAFRPGRALQFFRARIYLVLCALRWRSVFSAFSAKVLRFSADDRDMTTYYFFIGDSQDIHSSADFASDQEALEHCKHLSAELGVDVDFAY